MKSTLILLASLLLLSIISCKKPLDPQTTPTQPKQFNGRICFLNDRGAAWDLSTIKSDGTDLRVLVKDSTNRILLQFLGAKWSFDTSKIVFSSNRDGEEN